MIKAAGEHHKYASDIEAGDIIVVDGQRHRIISAMPYGIGIELRVEDEMVIKIIPRGASANRKGS